MQNNSGAILIEILISITIGSIILTSLIQNLSATTKNFYFLNKRISIIEGQLRLNSLLKRMIQEIDFHPVPILPIIHEKGRLNSVYGFKVNNSPEMNPKSNSISQIELRENTRMILVINNEAAKNIYCNTLHETNIRSIPKTDYILGLKGKEYSIFKVTEWDKVQVQDKNCYSVKGTPLTNTSFSIPTLIFPIRRIYTLIVDNELNLRFLTHKENRITENQPIIKLSQPLNLKFFFDNSKLFKLTSTSYFNPSNTLDPKNTIIANFKNKIKRQPIENLTMNWN